MAFEVIWTEPVWKDLETIVDYIDREWSRAVGDKYVCRTEREGERINQTAIYGNGFH